MTLVRRGGPSREVLSSAERVLLVMVCNGPRCAALQRLREDTHTDALRSAVRERPHSVLMSTGCLGRCAHGSVAAVGAAEATGSRLAWIRHPTLVGRVDDPARMALLAAWVSAGGRRSHLPPPLRHDDID